jgi:hypothetical protein
MEPVADQSEVRHAHIADLLPLSWNISVVLSKGKGLRVSWWKRLQAVMVLPILILLFLMYIPAGDVFTSPSRDAVIFLTEAKNAKKTLRRLGSIIGVSIAALCAFVIWLFSLTVLPDAVEPWIGLLGLLWPLTGLGLLTVSTAGSLSAVTEVVLRLRPREPYWMTQALASKPGAQMSGLEFAKAAIETFVPVGVPLVAIAATEKTAAIYERYGFVRQSQED